MGKECSHNVGDLGSIRGLGRSPSQEKGKGKGKGEGRRERVRQYSGLESSMDCIVHGVTKSQTQLSDSLPELSLQD